MRGYCIACLTFGLLAGCMMGPDYKRPEIDTPVKWRVDYQSASAKANSAWWEYFQDPVLNELIQTALQENKDLRIAALRVEEFDARLQGSRAGLYPQLGYGVAASRDRYSEQRAIPLAKDVSPTNNNYEVNTNFQWELDIWGRIRRANEAALAELLSHEENQRAVLLTLVSDVATGYIHLLSLDKELEISNLIMKNREEAMRLFELKYADGAIPELELVKSRAAYEESAAEIPVWERQIALQENALSVLLGRNSGSIKRGRTLDTLPVPPVPQGIPSEVLLRRPDVRQAEQELIAANANIGVAKSLYFPTISLTGLFGYASAELSHLPERASGYGTAGFIVSGPVFAGGGIDSQVHQTEAVQKEVLVQYLRTIQNAFREVEDALVSNQKSGERLAIQGRQVNDLQYYSELSHKRYDDGVSSYLEVLDAEQNLYSAEIKQSQTQRDEQIAVVSIYKAMGGGWAVDSDATNIANPKDPSVAETTPVADSSVLNTHP